MLNDLTYIVRFVVDNFIHIWPYLVISIPLAVLIRLSNASQYIERIFTGHPVKMILLATLVGAFSPFCSCSVIPVISSLLIAGVPLAPVMSFWIASPSMDPEIFLLSVGLLGWELATARVIATLVLSLSAGFVTQMLVHREFFTTGILREQRGSTSVSWRAVASLATMRIRSIFGPPEPVMAFSGSSGSSSFIAISAISEASEASSSATDSHSDSFESTWRHRLLPETLSVTWMIVQFMLIAFVLEALILLYIPQEAVINALGRDNALAIPMATLAGIPLYTTNLTAMPLISGLLEQGMQPGAALAFFIAGPTTTLPAMAAVYGITRRRVFALYLGIVLMGALVVGYVYQLMI